MDFNLGLFRFYLPSFNNSLLDLEMNLSYINTRCGVKFEVLN